MQVKLRKIGTSLGVLIPKTAIVGKQAGDTINIIIEAEDIIMPKPETIIIPKPQPTSIIMPTPEPHTSAPKPYAGELSKGRQVKGFTNV